MDLWKNNYLYSSHKYPSRCNNQSHSHGRSVHTCWCWAYLPSAGIHLGLEVVWWCCPLPVCTTPFTTITATCWSLANVLSLTASWFRMARPVGRGNVSLSLPIPFPSSPLLPSSVLLPSQIFHLFNITRAIQKPSIWYVLFCYKRSPFCISQTGENS